MGLSAHFETIKTPEAPCNTLRLPADCPPDRASRDDVAPQSKSMHCGKVLGFGAFRSQTPSLRTMSSGLLSIRRMSAMGSIDPLLLRPGRAWGDAGYLRPPAHDATAVVYISYLINNDQYKNNGEQVMYLSRVPVS